MKSIAIYIEGGGEGKDGKAALRQGFDALLSVQKQTARLRSLRWRVVLCGARHAAFGAFCQATASAGPGEVTVLLVDSEETVADVRPEGRLRHLPRGMGGKSKG